MCQLHGRAIKFHAARPVRMSYSSVAPQITRIWLLYLMQAEKRLAEEVERVKNYLDESTEPKITRVAENELIAAQVCRMLNI